MDRELLYCLFGLYAIVWDMYSMYMYIPCLYTDTADLPVHTLHGT